MVSHLNNNVATKSLSLALLLGLLHVLALQPALRAQVSGGTISGTVKDAQGSVIPRAEVAITNIETGVSRPTTTNEDGLYTAPNLIPGKYEVKFTASGFKTELRTGITLTVGAEEVVDLNMQIGTTTETIQVTGEAPAVQLTTSDISAVVNATTVRELPLNGRSWTDLATLQPGVNAIQTQPTFAAGTDRGNRGFGQQLTISGARPQQNNYRLDGVSLNDYANGAPGSVLGGNLGVDAIQEFSVLTTNYSAEYGKTSGGVVNAITRSGTNQIHGSIYEFLRNSALDARNYFDGDKIPPFKRNQFGGAVGGPIVKNNTFFAIRRSPPEYADPPCRQSTRGTAVLQSGRRRSVQSMHDHAVNAWADHRRQRRRSGSQSLFAFLAPSQWFSARKWRHWNLFFSRTASRK